MDEKSVKAVVLHDAKNEYPAHIIIVPSGWSNFYHVIKESPEDGDLYHKHSFIGETELFEKYPSLSKESFKDGT